MAECPEGARLANGRMHQLPIGGEQNRDLYWRSLILYHERSLLCPFRATNRILNGPRAALRSVPSLRSALGYVVWPHSGRETVVTLKADIVLYSLLH